MKIQCEVCEKAEAEVLCCSDEAVLCKLCDIKVHEANKLFQRHHRVALQKDAASATTASGAPLCDICQVPISFLFKHSLSSLTDVSYICICRREKGTSSA